MKSKNLSNKILRLIKSKGFKNIELDPVLETKYILQRSGENIRKYLFSFYNSDGRELCLRPDLTISSLLRYAQNNINAKEKVFYTGSAFRKSYNKKNVVVKQIGMEIFSSKNENKDDKEILDTSIKIIKKIGFKKANVKIGNFKLFELLIKKLSMPQRWKSRLLKFYWNEKYFSELLKRLQSNSDIDPIVVAGDKKNYLKMKKENPNKIIAGRSYREIIERYERKINDPRTVETGKYSVKIIREFLKIHCSIDKIERILKDFIKKYKLSKNILSDLTAIKNLSKISYKTIFLTNFGRDIEYYTGIVFEIYNSSKKEIARGGRYDGLLKSLGSKKNISAVGAAINLNNLKK